MTSGAWRRFFLHGCTAVWLAGAGSVWAADGGPDIRVVNGIETMCGGRTADETAFLNTVAPRWAATLEFAISRKPLAALPGDVKVRVLGQSSGEVVLQTVADGPLLLARLPPGRYEVEATAGGVTLAQTVSVQEGEGARTRFVWPSNLDFASRAGPAFREARAKGD